MSNVTRNTAPQDSPTTVHFGVLVSGNGTNLQALLDAEAAGLLSPAKIGLVISDRNGAYALERARRAGKPALLIEGNRDLDIETRRLDLSNRILETAAAASLEFLVLAGFLSILRGPLLERYQNRIINIHPSLLPKFGGPGMYGERVHQAVLAAGEIESGCTVHLVDQGTDTGPILLQRRVPVLPQDSPASLAERIHREEHIAIVDGVRELLAHLGYASKECLSGYDITKEQETR
ncbi:MAG: phosphoribosylglycinamide formyltransferase [Termitinemataceae bacterium]